jgi:hypothetical protein
VRVDVRRANRARTEHADLDPLKLPEGEAFLLLLRPGPAARRRPPVYGLVRGVRGARPLPDEGAAGVLDAVQVLVDIQDLGSHTRTWERMAKLLEDERPFLVEIALQQFVKFRQGGPEHVAIANRLLASSDAQIRRLAAELLGQLAERHPAVETEGGRFTREQLAARARRDPAPEVRIAAATALGSFEDAGVDEILAEMAAEDPDQQVRYVAETLIYDRRSERSGAEGRGGD